MLHVKYSASLQKATHKRIHDLLQHATNMVTYLECSESTNEHDRLPAVFKQGVDDEEECVAVRQGAEVLRAVVVDDHLLPVALLQSLLTLLRCGQVCQTSFALE